MIDYFIFSIFIIVPILIYDRPAMYISPKILAMNLLLVAAGICWIYRMWKIRVQNWEYTLFDMLLLLFIGYQAASLTWSINPHLGIEFLWLELLAVGLYLLIRTEIRLNILLSGVLGGLLIIGFPINLYALLQYLGIDFLTKPADFDTLAVSTFGNKNFLGEFLIFIMLIHFYFLTVRHSIIFYLAWGISFMLSLTVIMIILSKTTMLSFLILAIGIMVLYIHLYWVKIRRYRRKIAGMALAALVVLGLGYAVSAWIPFKVDPQRYYISFGYRHAERDAGMDRRQNLQAAINNQILMNGWRMRELFTMVTQSGGSENIMIRYYIWKNTLPIIREHLWFGTGLKNWQIHYFRFRGIEEKRIADHLAGSGATALDAHNEFLQVSAELGLIGLLLSLGLLGLLLYSGIRRYFTDSSLHDRFVSGLFTLYVILVAFQSLTGFTMHNVFPMISLSLVAPWLAAKQKRIGSLPGARWFFMGLVVVLGWGLVWNYRYLRRDYFTILSQIYLSRGDLRNAEIGYRNALHYTPDDYQLNFWLAGVLIEKAGYFQHRNQPDLYRQSCMDAVTCWKESLIRHPYLERAYYNIGNVYLEFGDYKRAEYYFLKAIEVFPTYTVAYTNLGNIYALIGIELVTADSKDQRAKALFEKALDHHLKAMDFYQNEYSYVKDPALLKNLGIDYHYLDMPSKAIEFYERYLQAVPALSPQEREEVLKAIDENRSRLP
ncbi:MAG: O-antigen ligase family protein [Candidatus Delongbacteria bacterium]|nr:O-antigen ligase family protein [Candidatus Delongbacteria bacterium]